MKIRGLMLALTVLAAACGAQENYLSDSGTYTVRQDLSISGNVVLSFQEVFIYRSISIGQPQSSSCLAYAKDHESKTGITVLPETLKLTYDENPGRHCSRRNAIKQCESYQYIYTFNCQFQTK